MTDPAAVLDTSERERAARLVRPELRTRAVHGRAHVRAVLGGLLGADPAALRFDRRCGFCGGDHGKPALAGAHGNVLDWSLSHSGDRGVLAVVPGHLRVGIDLEDDRPLGGAADLAARAYAPPEAAAVAAAPDPARAFLRLWTRKEAYLKALGGGIALGLGWFTVGDPGDPPVLAVPADPGAARGWALHDLDAGPGRLAALALGGRE